MPESIISSVLFFSIPTILIVLFGISAFRYFSAKKKNKAVPGTFTPKEIKLRKIIFIAFSVIVGAIALTYMVIAYM